MPAQEKREFQGAGRQPNVLVRTQCSPITSVLGDRANILQCANSPKRREHLGSVSVMLGTGTLLWAKLQPDLFTALL